MMRRICRMGLMIAASCRGSPETGPAHADTDTDTDTDTDSDTDVVTVTVTDTIADPEPTRVCVDLRYRLVQEFTQDQLIGAGPFGDLPEEQGPGLAVGDLDGDGALDAAFTVRGAAPVFLHNDGAGAWSAVPATLDGAAFPEASTPSLADLDEDGDLDLVLARAQGLDDLVAWNHLTAGSPWSFSSQALPGSQGERLTASFADANGDGRLDIFIGAYTHWFPPKSRAGDGVGLYFQQADHSFTDETTRIPEGDRIGLTFLGAWLDADRDHDLDLFLANDCYNIGTCTYSNVLLRNDGAGGFTRAEDCACNDPMAAMGVAVGDPNGDGFPDLFVTNWGPVEFYLNYADGSFLKASDAYGLEVEDPNSVVTWGARFADLDVDGDEDLVVQAGPPDLTPEEHPSISEQQLHALLLQHEGRFTDQTVETDWIERGIGRASVVADLTGDLRPELIVWGHVFVRVYEPFGGCPAGIGLSIDGGPGNPHGVGAHVEIVAAGRTHSRFVHPATTFGSSVHDLEIGLGEAEFADSITVTFPGGGSVVHHDIPAGTRLAVVHP